MHVSNWRRYHANIVTTRNATCTYDLFMTSLPSLTEAGVDALIEKMTEAFKNKDVNALVSCYTCDCQVLMDGREIYIGHDGKDDTVYIVRGYRH